jgi:hypothetical protein
MLTLTQAAQEVGRTRSTLFKAIKAGRLSATKDAQGHFIIDPVELHRVYVAVNVSQGNQNKQQDTGSDTQEIAFLRRENELLRDQIEREREETDHWRKQATMLLIHQPAQPEQPISQTGGKEPSKLLIKLFGNHWPEKLKKNR